MLTQIKQKNITLSFKKLLQRYRSARSRCAGSSQNWSSHRIGRLAYICNPRLGFLDVLRELLVCGSDAKEIPFEKFLSTSLGSKDEAVLHQTVDMFSESSLNIPFRLRVVCRVIVLALFTFREEGDSGITNLKSGQLEATNTVDKGNVNT